MAVVVPHVEEERAVESVVERAVEHVVEHAGEDVGNGVDAGAERRHVVESGLTEGFLVVVELDLARRNRRCTNAASSMAVVALHLVCTMRC